MLVAICGTALLVRFVLPMPAGLDAKSWSLLIIFLASLVSLIAQLAPMSIVFLTALSIGAVTRILTPAQVLAGYSNNVLWLIIIAFIFARAFLATGLARRIALMIIQRMGTNSLGLGYCLSLTDLILAPVTPSNTARAGAIIFPIAVGLSQECGSYPGVTSSKIGGFLLFTAYQANLVTSALFLTAMASNPLAVEFARQVAGVNISWSSWLVASSLPGLLSFVLIPYFIYKRYPPELRHTSLARKYALEELNKLGPARREEKILAIVFVVLAALWATSLLHGIDAVVTALGGLCVLLWAEVLTSKDLIEEQRAWETFIWWGGMLSIVTALNQSSVPKWFAAHIASGLAGVSPLSALFLLVVAYTYIHYAFAGQTAHVVALYIPFLTVAVSVGAPPLLAALLRCFFSNLNSSLTHYSDGAAPIYYGSGYIDQKDWWRLGFQISILHLLVWLGIGLPWWKFLKIW
jgi:DASS family divalent anion:Na+ symporter